MKLGALLLANFFLGNLHIGNTLAHSGGLNAQGCHEVRKTGEIHCHAARNLLPQNIAAASKINGSFVSVGKCGNKNFCKQMYSCEEAVYYLYICGVVRLDGDNDGIPCESLCGNNTSGKSKVADVLKNLK